MPAGMLLKSQTRLKTATGASPTGGQNTVSPYAEMDPHDAISLINLIPGAYGTRVRLGTNQWTASIPGSAGVRAILPFIGTTSTNSKLFAVTNLGIYDCTTKGASPTQVVSFSTTTGLAGFGASTSFTTLGDHWLIYCDEANGYYTYQESLATWTKVTMGTGAGQVSGVDPTTFTFPLAWQNRLYFCRHGDATGWYLGFSSIYGAATQYNFGANMKSGGELKCMANFTYDGGVGSTNNLAVLSQSGDLSVYTGTDPSTAGQFTLTGNWFVGGYPTGRLITQDSGGDVLIMTSQGLVSLAKLLQGVSLADRSIFATWKVDNIVAQQVLANQANLGWRVITNPNDQTINISIPQSNGTFTHLAMSYQTQGWGQLFNYPSQSMGVWQNQLYMGDIAGNLWTVSGNQDLVLLNGSGAQDISWSVFGSFQGLGDPAIRKRAHLVKPALVTGDNPISLLAECRFDFDLTPNGTPPGVQPQVGGLWDVAKWDQALWGGGSLVQNPFLGVLGTGYMVAVLLAGYSSTPTTIANVSLLYDEGTQL